MGPLPFSPSHSAGSSACRCRPFGEVAVERPCRLPAERDGSGAPTLAEHGHLAVVKVHVIDLQRGQLGATNAGVEEEEDDRGVAALYELLALVGPQQGHELLCAQRRHLLLGQHRRSHPGHRVGRVLLGRVPLRELLQRPEQVAGVAGCPGVEDADDEVADVLGLDVGLVGNAPFGANPGAELAGGSM